MFTKTKQQPASVALVRPVDTGLRREAVRRDLTLALSARDDAESVKSGFNPYDSDQGSTRRDVWGERRR